MSNRLKMAIAQAVLQLHAQGWSFRRIARELHIDRETVSRYVRLAEAKAAKAPTGSETPRPDDSGPLGAGDSPLLGSKPATEAPTGSEGQIPVPASGVAPAVAEFCARQPRRACHPPSGAYHFTARLVGSAIYTLGLSRRQPPAVDLTENEWWARDIADAIGVTLTRFRHWIKLGFVNVRRIGRRGNVVIWADADELDRLPQLRDHPRQNRLAHYPAGLVHPKKVTRPD